jgi:hypothetical protein
MKKRYELTGATIEHENTKVFDSAKVFDQAKVFGSAQVFGLQQKGGEFMKNDRTYRKIESVSISDGFLHGVYFEEDPEFLAPEEILRTKDDVLKDAENVLSFGSGKYSGIQLRQLPQKIIRQIKQRLGDKYYCCLADSEEEYELNLGARNIANTYRKISAVNVHYDHVYSVFFERGDEVLSPEEVLTTKDDVLKDARLLTTCGHGKYCGVEVWQLPEEMKQQIKKLLGKRYFCSLSDSDE